MKTPKETIHIATALMMARLRSFGITEQEAVEHTREFRKDLELAILNEQDYDTTISESDCEQIESVVGDSISKTD